MKKDSGRSLVGILVGCAVAIGAAVFFIFGSSLTGDKAPERADGQGKTVVGKSLLAGKDSKCRSNLDQVRGSIALNTDPIEDTKPATIEETRLGAQFYVCPVGNEKYVYDSTTGQVSCPHPGHEKF